MKHKHSLLFLLLMVSAAFTACDAGKYYARKKIDRHYETVNRSHPPAPVVSDTEERHMVNDEVSPIKNGTAADAVNETAVEYPVSNNRKQVIFARETPVHEQKQLTREPNMEQPATTKENAGEKSIERGLALLLVGLLFILLGFLMLYFVGALGLIFATIFFIIAVVLIVVGLIAMVT